MTGIVVIAIIALIEAGLIALARRRLATSRFVKRIGLGVAAALAVSGGILATIYGLSATHSIERDPGLLWGWTCASSVLIGGFAAARAKRMPTWELFIGSLIALDGAVVLTFLGPFDHALTSAAVRSLLMAPAVLATCTYFGASIGFLFFASGEGHLALGYEAQVGKRFLLSKSSAAVSVVTAISLIGVALGVVLVISALAILSGFELDLRTKIIGATAHATIESATGEEIELTPTLVDEIANTPGVVAASPFVQGEVAMAKAQSNYTGSAILVGIDPYRSPKVLQVLNQVIRGSLDDLKAPLETAKVENENPDFAPPARTAGIIIGRELADSLQLKIGERVRVLSPMLEVLTPVGVAPKSVGLQVVGIFSSKMYDYDAHLAFVTIDEARRFFEIGPHAATGVQILTVDPERSDLIGNDAVANAVSSKDKLHLIDWKARNATLFSALKLERVVAFVVLAFIILVASFSIVNTLTMTVIEKKKEIAILKTMGATDAGIMKIFITQGMLVGCFGIAGGIIGARAAVTGLSKVWLPNDVYYIDALPVQWEWLDVILVALSALLIVWNFAVFPALRGSALTPVEGLRDG